MSDLNHIADVSKKVMTRAEMLAKLEAVENCLEEFATLTDPEFYDYLYEVIEALRAETKPVVCPKNKEHRVNKATPTYCCQDCWEYFEDKDHA